MTDKLQKNQEVSIENPKVQNLARRFHWKPDTLIKKIQSELPSVVEQKIYLEIAPSFKFTPRSMKIILRTYLGDRELTTNDVIHNPKLFDELNAFLENVLPLLDKESLEYEDVGVAMMTASKLALLYGDHAEKIVDSIEANIDVIAIRLNMEHRSPERVMGYALHFLVSQIIKYGEKHGLPRIVDVMEFFESDRNIKEYITTYVGGDAYSTNDQDWRSYKDYLDNLRRNEIW